MTDSRTQIVLGVGTGQCGLSLLHEILARQPGVHVTREEPPGLPWTTDDPAGLISRRFARWKAGSRQRLVGDIAHFYLPYVEHAIAAEPDIRIICLRRPREEVVAAFQHALGAQSPLPVNHWSPEPGDGWQHDPLRSFTYPKYTAADRTAALRQYWDEYDARSTQLADAYPENFLLAEAASLTTGSGVERMLDFLRIPAETRQVVTGHPPPELPAVIEADMPEPRFADPHDPRRCAVLVPFYGMIHNECEQALRELERRGYTVVRVSGYAAIDQARNQLATDALVNGFEETLWVDADIVFNPDDVEKLRRHDQAVVCGIYPQKSRRAFACEFLPGTERVTFGTDGGILEILYAGTGFLLVRREVYAKLQQELALPVCNDRFKRPMVPFFEPMTQPIDDGHWYLAEDFSFCERARRCGFDVHADTSIRLWHIGHYPFGWEEAGLERARHDSFTLNAVDSMPD